MRQIILDTETTGLEPEAGHRVIESVEVSLEDIKKIRELVDGATVNDVVLSMVGGALLVYQAPPRWWHRASTPLYFVGLLLLTRRT